MRRLGRWAAWGAAGIAGVLLLAAAGVWLAAGAAVNRHWPVPVSTLKVASDPGAVARGARLSMIFGCHDCHGADLTGAKFFDEPGIARFWGPNLTRIAARDSDAQLDLAIRHGVRPNGEGLWIMPSQMLNRLSDAETADLIAYLRSLKPTGPDRPSKLVRPKGRIGALLGKFEPAPAMILKNRGADLPDYGPAFAAGRSLSRACIECHGAKLQGDAFVGTPDLNVAAAYDPADFKRLLRTGIAAGNRRLGLMSESAPLRFRAMTDAEIDALQAYLKARAERQPPA
jgi:cytochrome c553